MYSNRSLETFMSTIVKYDMFHNMFDDQQLNQKQ